VVVFHGRNSAKPHVTDDLLAALSQPIAQPGHSGTSAPSRVANARPAPSSAASSQPRAARGWAARPAQFDIQQQQAPTTWEAAPAFPYWKKPKPKPEQEAQEPAPTVKRTARGIRTIADGNPKGARRTKGQRKMDNRQLRDVITSDDDDDEAAEAAYNDYMENLRAQMDAEAKIEETGSLADAAPKAGPSTSGMPTHGQSDEWEDDESDDSDDEPIGQDLYDSESDMDSSELEDELEYREQEQYVDEEDLRQRRIDAMTDEKIARLFAKQHELGIDGDELVIDDGFDGTGDDDEGIGDLIAARIGLRDITNSSTSTRSRNKHGMRASRRKNGDFSYPDASALADAVEQYGENGFDIMDYDRPSLRPVKKGRKGKLLAELADGISDDDLKEELNNAWANDREKKRLRKLEREELRAQGLLGGSGKKGKADLSQKYLEGMTMEQVHEELRAFLQNDDVSTRPFPPMDKRDRKALHEIANMLNLKSKSVGTGNNRFPVLYKTSRTMDYGEGYFNRIISASSRRFLKNAGAKKGKGKGAAKMTPRAGKGGGFNKAAVSIRDGEVVGSGAAEIGSESFGHKMMEKMGWSKGMALGKEGEGLLVPVEQVMRSGTRGLG
jgi:predicted RNA-binding protein Jag